VSLKKAILILLSLLILISLVPTVAFAIVYGNSDKLENTGEMIVRIQTRLRDLGFFLFKPTGRFQGMTTAAAIEFQKLQLDNTGNAIMIDGTVGDQTSEILFSNNAQRAVIPGETHIPIGPSSAVNVIEGTIVPWSEVKGLLVQNASYEIADCVTGKTFYMTLIGGENHAEMECTTPEDTEIFLDVFGDCFNYSKRAMVIILNGKNILCSIQGEPHGIDSIAGNKMDGSVCVYFDGSSSHVGNIQDVEHLNKIYSVSK